MSGDIQEGDSYDINWNNKVEKKVIIKNVGNLPLQYKASLVCNGTPDKNMEKYLKIQVKDKNDNIIKSCTASDLKNDSNLFGEGINMIIKPENEDNFTIEFELQYTS